MNQDKTFAGRSVIVTGGTRGIGKAIVLELARSGANVAFNYSKSADEAQALKSEVEKLGVKALAEQCDVANTEIAPVLGGKKHERVFQPQLGDVCRERCPRCLQ